jgi:hypothetical protein
VKLSKCVADLFRDKSVFAFFLVCLASGAFAADFKTLDGTVYKDATVKRVEADGIVLLTDSGISKVYFTELPREVQERFEHHPAAAGVSAAAGGEATAAAVATKPVAEQEYRTGVADTAPSTGQLGTNRIAPTVSAQPQFAPETATTPVPPTHTYELKQDYVIGGDTGAVAKRLTRGQRYRGRDVADGIQLEIDGKSYTVPRDILSAAKD